MPPETDDSTDPSSLVADVLTGSEVDTDRVPTLLGFLDVGDRQVRLGSAAALCVVADEHPDIVGYLAGRLADRADGETGLAAALALDYLAALDPDTVADELEGDDARPTYGVERSAPTREGQSNRDIGRTRLAGTGSDYGPRQVYTDDGEENGDSDAGGGGGEDSDSDAGRTIGQRPPANDAEWFSLVTYESRFDDFTILSPRDRGRYGDSYRTLGVADDEEYAVSLRLLRSDAASSFVEALRSQLRTWTSVSDAENVVSVYDWNTAPLPWLAAEYADETLAERSRFPPPEAAWQAEQLASALATLHERGVVHAGIDAQAVAYYGNVLTEDDRQPPMLDSVGLLHVYRQYADPSNFLDPRYAAPEYYERRFGRIDHATDIYQLGAVCYRLFTGRPPYTGSFAAVRDAVIDGPPPTPSDVADVPTAVDDIVGKAMATQKLRRYETAAHVAQELRALREPQENDAK
ncbi:serine/threonine protein kinase [Haloarcula marina]|uniref:serine/threonine protein kinase n=1 Tax=Haloarcula marina TaxID=2961574 RepID=UPI0020B7A6BE|nr:protein kinase [Halomicroarcula marina]